jgi:hypothetical protein
MAQWAGLDRHTFPGPLAWHALSTCGGGAYEAELWAAPAAPQRSDARDWLAGWLAGWLQVQETPELYAAVVEPHIASIPASATQWVRNILSKTVGGLDWRRLQLQA